MENSNSNIFIDHNNFFNEVKNSIKELPNLTQRENEVIKRRFGLNGSKTYTLDEIGHNFGVTREMIRQNEAKAIKKIRNTLFNLTVSFRLI